MYRKVLAAWLEGAISAKHAKEAKADKMLEKKICQRVWNSWYQVRDITKTMGFIYKDLVHKVVEAVLPKKQAANDLYEMKLGQRVIAKWRDMTREEKRRHYGNSVRATAFHRRSVN